ncbi:helix-turn-helix transcriptional regulator [Microlunatus soli]|uniref:helix-turn-helix transcriptional regulator n=1 Tax=Microlunatus soli TaxID=630515 RepID=UPI0012FBE6B1|nr:LuxR C-terminal-related transcriptional regulator [Microlunatus soli]
MLWNELDHADSPVTMLIAPAGAGKTLGVAGWVRHRHRTMDDADGSPAAIWIDAGAAWNPGRLASLIDRGQVAATAGPSQAIIEADPGRDGTDDGLARNADASTAAPAAPNLIVIDDAQRLPAATIRFIDERLSHEPASLRLLLLSRWDLLQTSLVAQLLGDLAVIRGDVLRLADDEATELIQQHARTDDAAVTEAIISRAGGWCAAVVLAARSVRMAPDPLQMAANFGAGDTRFADRVANEVMAALSHRERHLLLCVAGEVVVAADTAAHLSRNPEAPQLLAEMASDGLLVTRVSRPERAGSQTADGSDPDAAAWYRIHPLLREVVRRRMAAGGVDVEQARGTVAVAVHLDLARGVADRAFERLISINLADEAAALLADDGIAMIACGQGKAISRFVRTFPEQVADYPDAWFPIAVERWIAGDVDAARHWLDRIVQHSTDRSNDLEAVCAELMQARITREQLRAVTTKAQDVIARFGADGEHTGSTQFGLVTILLIELGAAQNWLGELDSAERNLTACIGLCRNVPRLSAIAASATSYLAMTQLMLGREHTAALLADEASLAGPYPVTGYTADRASLVHDLATMADVPWTDTNSGRPARHRSLHPTDFCSQFWARLYEARARAGAGDLIGAEQILTMPFDLPIADDLPSHLKVVIQVERGCLAALVGDVDGVGAIEADLGAAGMIGEKHLLAGIRSDLSGQPQSALEDFELAVTTTHQRAAGTRALALTCLAQLLDASGRASEALGRLREAAAETAIRRNALVFLGLCRHGTPMQVLLAALRETSASPWVHEVAAAMQSRADLSAICAATMPSPSEQIRATELPVRPVLSSRERDVLRELARGSTYADIGVELFVSENTVKTHVSNLYAKLGASRRSEALSIARGLHLL